MYLKTIVKWKKKCFDEMKFKNFSDLIFKFELSVFTFQINITRIGGSSIF